MGPERRIETAFLRWLKGLQKMYRFRQYKLQILGVKGYPDRTIKLPGNCEICIEFKAPGGVLSPNQRLRIEELTEMDVPVLVTSSLTEAKEWTMNYLRHYPR